MKLFRVSQFSFMSLENDGSARIFGVVKSTFLLDFFGFYGRKPAIYEFKSAARLTLHDVHLRHG